MGRGFKSLSLVNDITRPVSSPAKTGSRLLLVDLAPAGKNFLVVPTILVTSVSYGSSPDVLKKEAIGLKGKVKRFIRLRGSVPLVQKMGRRSFSTAPFCGGEFRCLARGPQCGVRIYQGVKRPSGSPCSSGEVTCDPKSTDLQCQTIRDG
jgi:hypothetical protein